MYVEHRGIKGGKFSFSGWSDYFRPSACFDRGDYIRCLHGVLLALDLIGSPNEVMKLISDEGTVHELVHLADGLHVSTHNSMETLRQEVVDLENRVYNTYGKEDMKPLVIYHSPCMDGFAAASVIWDLHPDWEFVPGVHGTPPPDVKGREVYMVDFSYKRPVMEKIVQEAKRVVVIDHHITAQEDLRPLYDDGLIEGIFDVNHSGARLTWDYFHPAGLRKHVPAFIDFVEDRDLWRFRYPETKEICAAVFSLPYYFSVYRGLFETCEDEVALNELQRQGAAILRKHDKDVEELVAKCHYTLEVGGISVPAANIPYTYASDAGHLMSEGHPFAATYFFDGKNFLFSLRSKEHGIDVSEIAKKYGGGGHKHAAGFQVPSLEALALEV